jgi:hypothetical protein
MWNITSDDVQQAKERLEHRRTAVEAKYAEDKQALDAELAVVETLERAAAEFADKCRREDVDGAAETAPPADPDPHPDPPPRPRMSGEVGGARDILKPGSRWRLHLGNRPADSEAAAPASM